jgi:hypothetical protein
MVTAMMRAFGSLTVRLVGYPWLKVICALNFVSKSFPAEELGILVSTGILESLCALLVGMSGFSRTARKFECWWLSLL